MPNPRIFYTTDLCAAVLKLVASTALVFATTQLGTGKFLRAVKAGGLAAMLDALMVMPVNADSDLEGSPSGIQVPLQQAGEEYRIRVVHMRKIQPDEPAEMVTAANTDIICDACAANPTLLGCGLPPALTIYRCWPVSIDYMPPELVEVHKVETQVDANAIMFSITARAPRYF